MYLDKYLYRKYPVFVWKRNFFLTDWPSVHTYPVKTIAGKQNFSKTLSRVEMFENAVFVFSCEHLTTELFYNDDVMRSNWTFSKRFRVRWPLSSDTLKLQAKTKEEKLAFSIKDGYVWTGKYDWKRVDTKIFLKPKKPLTFSNENGYMWTRLYVK